MGATLKEYTEAGGGTSGAAVMAAYAKTLATRLVADVSWLTVDTTTSDTSTLFDQTLAISWDSNIKLRIYNSSTTAFYYELQYNGAIIDSSTSNVPHWGGAASTTTITTHIVYGANFLFVGFSVNGSPSGIAPFFGQVENYYDNNKATYYNGTYFTGPSNTPTAYVLTATERRSLLTGASGFSIAFFAPYTNWGGSGHLYAAVPTGVRNANAAEPVIGFIGGTDNIYTMYDNGGSFPYAPHTQFSINGHSFFLLKTGASSSNMAFRIS